MAEEEHSLATGSKARASFIWISPSKVRQVADLLRGKPVDEARRILAFNTKAGARYITKVLESAVANAEHNHHIPQEELYVKSVWADDGPTFKRVRPRARRAAYFIRKRTSHINVAVERLPESQIAKAEPARTRPRASTEKTPVETETEAKEPEE